MEKSDWRTDQIYFRHNFVSPQIQRLIKLRSIKLLYVKPCWCSVCVNILAGHFVVKWQLAHALPSSVVTFNINLMQSLPSRTCHSFGPSIDGNYLLSCFAADTQLELRRARFILHYILFRSPNCTRAGRSSFYLLIFFYVIWFLCCLITGERVSLYSVSGISKKSYTDDWMFMEFFEAV